MAVFLFMVVCAGATFARPLGASPPPTRPNCDGKGATIVGRGEIRGTKGRDVIVGSPGDDVIHAGRGSDVVCAGAGRDRVFGGHMDDRLFGEDGHDRLDDKYVGNNWFDGGDGRDTVSFAFATTDVGISLEYPRGQASSSCDSEDAPEGVDCPAVVWIDELRDIENAIGSRFDDFLRGGPGRNKLRGLGGPDEIHGGSWDDALFGGRGHDRLWGGADDDGAVGGAGMDNCNAEFSHESCER